MPCQILNLHIHIPIGDQERKKAQPRVDDCIATFAAEVFFEIKFFNACKNQYDHNNAVWVGMHIKLFSYDQNFKKRDSLFAADIVGDGTSDVAGPFEAAKTRFFRGHVEPVCADWCGEINKNYNTLLKKLAREAAAGDDGMRISSSVNWNRKQGDFQIMLQQFGEVRGL